MTIPNSMYFIALVLPEEINQKVMPLKQWMFDKYQCKVGLRSPAHITLIPPFWMEESMESDLVKEIDVVSNSLKVFHVATNNFSSFKPSTIFIALQENEILNNTKNAVDEHFKKNSSFKIKLDPRPFHPHITIATRDLFKKAYYEAWEHFREKEFRMEATISGISILKHNKKNWDVFHTSQFSK
jgi:2'-5' RNA ligase